MNVRPRLSRYSARLSSLEESEAVSCIGDGILALALYENTRVLVFSDVQRLLSVSVLKQIVEFLVVDLQE